MTCMEPSPAHGSLSVLLSQALVAFTIEIDNEAELRLPHSTTRHRSTASDSDRRRGPWLTSFVMYANVLRYVGEEGTTVARLTEHARTTRLQLAGLQRWRYVTVEPPTGLPARTLPHPESLVLLTPGGRRACSVWADMPRLVEDRWRARFGGAAVDGLRRSLVALIEALPFDTPAYLPMVFPTQNGKAERLSPREGGASPPTWSARTTRDADLTALLSAVLLSFTLDVEAEARISMAIGSNTLRVLQPCIEAEPVSVRDLPRLTGVSKEANAMCAGWLARHGCVEVVPNPAANRGKVVRLTAKGRAAQSKHQRLLDSTETLWRTTYGAASLGHLVDALVPIVGDGTFAASPLAAGLEPSEGTWRASVSRPETLPHYPMVLHRGGYPDGS
jgi:DNA-binding MarR family transcriptional regulator